MAKKITAFTLCFYFLSGSIIFPLGDFSLMKELPGMYRSYEKLVSENERGVLDFVGDYLLGGKDILGHNKNDVPDSARSTTQFQHTANFCSMVTPHLYLNAVIINEHHIIHRDNLYLRDLPKFHNELLRPPLA